MATNTGNEKTKATEEPKVESGDNPLSGAELDQVSGGVSIGSATGGAGAGKAINWNGSTGDD